MEFGAGISGEQIDDYLGEDRMIWEGQQWWLECHSGEALLFLAIQFNDLCTGGQDWHTGSDTMLWIIQMMF